MSIGTSIRDKILSIKQLAEVAAQLRGEDKKVVLTHGTFDLFHLGHLRHLKEAKSHGSVLIVTVTADGFVNKGPGRPVFSEYMRAEILAALECVDYVGISHAFQSIGAIDEIKPDVYVKGNDYSDESQDVTGGIVTEKAAVERYGGTTIFTDDIVFSSSSLINKYLSVFDPTLDEYLESQRSIRSLESILKLLEKAKDLKILVIGDAIIDDYNYVSALGKSSKEMMISTLAQNQEVFAGGVFAAANHVASFCKEVEVITTVAKDCEYEKTILDSLKSNVKLNTIKANIKHTTRKVRFIDQSYLRKVFEIYYMDDRPSSPDIEKKIINILEERGHEFDIVIVTDFGHGLITGNIVGALQKHSKFLAVNTQTNSANAGYNLITKYDHADYICIDAPEARLAVGDQRGPIEDITSEHLPRLIDCNKIIVTHGKNGCVGSENDSLTVHVPAFTKTVVDTVGAGDAFFTITAAMAAAGASIDQLAMIGNAAGALKVGIVGHRSSVEDVALIKFLTTLLK